MSSSTIGFSIHQIGTVSTTSGFSLTVAEPFRQGLAGLDEFSHAVVLWVAHETEEGSLVLDAPYVRGPENIGVFATRSASRPNRLGVSVAPLTRVDPATGVVEFGWIDAVDNTPVVDLKPYFPSSDRVADAATPQWCSHWPQNLEASATFDWESVFN